MTPTEAGQQIGPIILFLILLYLGYRAGKKLFKKRPDTDKVKEE
jgi:hypothetical protein